ncbi:MAG: collagen-binding domain-containing protein [Lachnospiraceae bacterium]
MSSGSGLQGTFLAPKAAVTVGSDLSGAVYAKKVTVADGVQKLLRVAYIKGAKDEAETEAVTEAATEI